MSFTNDKTREINCKIVYYGPALCGKSTSLRHIYSEIRKGAKGDMVSLSQDNDRTLFFDFVPLNVGKIRGYTVRLHLYTVPGEVGYQQSRALISKGVDGVVFVADSALERMESNLKSLDSLKEILKGEGHAWGEIPCVYQYNKRDMANAVPLDELRRYLNSEGGEEHETVATTGEGVFDAFRSISTQVLRGLKNG
ncbi:MAG: GTPase domain-containing protein [Pseudomonadota bacterium]